MDFKKLIITIILLGIFIFPLLSLAENYKGKDVPPDDILLKNGATILNFAFAQRTIGDYFVGKFSENNRYRIFFCYTNIFAFQEKTRERML